MQNTIKAILGALLLVLVMSSCELFTGTRGSDGQAYLKFTFDYDDADGFIADFPDTEYDGQSAYQGAIYESTAETAVKPGTFTGTYVLFWTDYDSILSYITYFNDPGNFYVYGGSSSTANLNFFLNSNSFEDYYNTVSYTITENKGGAGSFLTNGTDGADTHFTIAFAWDAIETEIYSSNVAASQATIAEETTDHVVKELVDGNKTLRVTLPKSANGASKGSPSKSPASRDF